MGQSWIKPSTNWLRPDTTKKEIFHKRYERLCHYIAKALGFKPGEYNIKHYYGGIATFGEVELRTKHIYMRIMASTDADINRYNKFFYRYHKNNTDMIGGMSRWGDFADLHHPEKILKMFNYAIKMAI